MHVHNLELNALSCLYNFVLLEGICFSAIVLQESLYQLKLADFLRLGPITMQVRKRVCTAVWPVLLHVSTFCLLPFFFFKYNKSPSALVQAFIQLIIHQEIFVVYMSAVVLLKNNSEVHLWQPQVVLGIMWESRGVQLFQADAQKAVTEGFISFLLWCKAECTLCRNPNYVQSYDLGDLCFQ